MLVLGGAGVGKTTTALWAARRELTRGGTLRRTGPNDRVLFVTFSRTAVAQIRNRASGVLADLGDCVEILTFHGLAYRLIAGFSYLVGLKGTPRLVGEARAKLAVGSASDTQIKYDDLLPLALRLLETPGPVADLLCARWSLVICDEFQDTDDLEWRLLTQLGRKARLLLLADPNQMIYQFKDGVSEARLDAARARPEAVEHTLPPGSHRDPSQVLPDAAAEVRWRRFETPPVQKAATEGRLLVRAEVPDDEDERAEAIAEELGVLRASGHGTIGIYAKTNSDAAGLSAALTAIEIQHVPIGFNEAYGEALSAMATMVEFSFGQAEFADVRSALATTLTANVRSPNAPQLAVALHEGGVLPGDLGARLEMLRTALRAPDVDLTGAAELSAASWNELAIASGRRAWSRAGRSFLALVSRARLDAAPVAWLRRSVEGLRNASFVELDAGDSGAIQLMNFSQTKGREADAVILSYGSADWYGRAAREPYDEPSRLLYVSMTRARRTVVVMLPAQPHELVAPFLRYAG
jgi:DNA helicase-2/ATP-dependent DNA helicase PcrA